MLDGAEERAYSACMLTRREFATGLAALGGRAFAATGAGVVFEGYAIAPRAGVQEAILESWKDGRYWLLFGEGKRLVRKVSADAGRSWGATELVRAVDGSEIPTGRDNVHLSVLALRSGEVGILYGGPYARPGRDGTALFRKSKDGGANWSAPVTVDPLFALCRTQGARVLRSGRIVAPVFNWYSAFAGGESEEAANSLCVSWVYYSDDEGKTWKRSLSELLVSIDQGRRGVYSFEEPCVQELKDGRVLMYGRTELGQFYQTVSKDGGVTWSVPRGVPLAASYAPPMIVRIPATGDLLLVWNQASPEEILAGLHRHRLSTAISPDEGETWTHFRNLESLDDRTHLEAPPPQVYRMTDYKYKPPVDPKRYPHAPGCLRICYPTVAFHENEAAFAYDYGYGGTGELQKASATKVKIVSLDWLYGRAR
jgi:hypothetical protein